MTPTVQPTPSGLPQHLTARIAQPVCHHQRRACASPLLHQQGQVSRRRVSSNLDRQRDPNAVDNQVAVLLSNLESERAKRRLDFLECLLESQALIRYPGGFVQRYRLPSSEITVLSSSEP
jgi:hypothetical protein